MARTPRTTRAVAADELHRLRRDLAQRDAELQHSNATLKESLDQQTATADVLRVIAGGPTDSQKVLDSIALAGLRLCEADRMAIYLREGDTLRAASQSRPVMTRARALAGPITPEWVAGRSVLERRTIHVEDLHREAHVYPISAAIAKDQGHRTLVVTPLLRRGEAVGALSLTRVRAEPFTERQLTLLETFADQAVIAIENARVFSELQDSNRALTEQKQQLTAALEQQTATAEVLRVISSSPSDLTAALDTLIRSAMRLCGATNAAIFRVSADGGELYAAAGLGPVYDASSALPPSEGQSVRGPIVRGWVAGRAALERRTVQVADIAAESDDEYLVSRSASRRVGQHLGREFGYRTVLCVPLMSQDGLIGIMSLNRSEPQPFTDQHIQLLETFADQAVIAIENARLFSELQDSHRTLTESLAQQTAIADVLRVIASSPTDLEPVLTAILDRANSLCDASSASLWRLEGGTLIHDVARTSVTLGLLTARFGGLRRVADLAWGPGRIALTGQTVHLPDLAAVTPAETHEADWMEWVQQLRSNGDSSWVGTPLLREGRAIGVLVVARTGPTRPFSPPQIAVLESFASQAAIALENTRLFSELREQLEQQTATAEVLRVISSSPTDLEDVLFTIIGAAARLCNAAIGTIFYTQGSGSVNLTIHRETGVLTHASRSGLPLTERFGGATSIARAMHDRRPIHHPDFAAAAREYGYHPRWVGAVQRDGSRAQLVAPLLREDSALGAIELKRSEIGPFTEQQISLLQSFADQAVIAIENTRLFSELRERDERRRLELERASAIQQRLLPAAVEGWPGQLEIAHRFRPAVETSGDFYDVFRLSPASEGALPPLQIAVGDVAGKGMSAALVTALARSALRTSEYVPTAMASPAGTLRAAGQRLHRDVGGQHFVACVLAVVEPPGVLTRGPLMRLANAAQVPVLLCRDGVTTEIVPPGDRLPLGVRPDGAYRDAEVELRTGDTVIFSSDGLVEAPALPGPTLPGHVTLAATAGEMLGFVRFADLAAYRSTNAASAEEVAAGIWSDLAAWCGEDPHHDDMTLLVLRVPR